ncbi:hypothetical protein [Parashewanella tropica]|uniref:hypothetical protein n=1 Tax=Parashewanella tropica TaxID=2547970 RepID=UPI001059E30C|nr:hypothetical protein [Parashewanella tropica]
MAHYATAQQLNSGLAFKFTHDSRLTEFTQAQFNALSHQFTAKNDQITLAFKEGNQRDISVTFQVDHTHPDAPHLYSFRRFMCVHVPAYRDKVQSILCAYREFTSKPCLSTFFHTAVPSDARSYLRMPSHTQVKSGYCKLETALHDIPQPTRLQHSPKIIYIEAVGCLFHYEVKKVSGVHQIRKRFSQPDNSLDALEAFKRQHQSQIVLLSTDGRLLDSTESKIIPENIRALIDKEVATEAISAQLELIQHKQIDIHVIALQISTMVQFIAFFTQPELRATANLASVQQYIPRLEEHHKMLSHESGCHNLKQFYRRHPTMKEELQLWRLTKDRVYNVSKVT